MSIEEKLRLLAHFDSLIRNNIKGNGTAIAKRLGVAPSTFFRMLEYAKRDLNAPIVFDHELQRYTYQTNGMLFFGFLSEEIVSVEQMKSTASKNLK